MSEELNIFLSQVLVPWRFILFLMPVIAILIVCEMDNNWDKQSLTVQTKVKTSHTYIS